MTLAHGYEQLARGYLAVVRDYARDVLTRDRWVWPLASGAASP